VQNFLGRWGPVPYRDMDVADRLDISFSSPQLCYRAKLCRSRSNRSSVIVEICQKILTSQASPFEAEHTAIAPRLLEPTRIDRATYNFLSVLHSNKGLCRTVFETNGNICKIFPPRTCNAPAGGVRLGIL